MRVVILTQNDAAGIKLTQTPKDAKLGGKGLAVQGLRRTPFKPPCSADPFTVIASGDAPEVQRLQRRAASEGAGQRGSAGVADGIIPVPEGKGAR